MLTSGSSAKALSRAFAAPRARDDFGQPDLAAQRLLDGVGDAARRGAPRPRPFEFARHRDGVEREPVGRGVDLRVDDVGARHRAGAGDDRQQPRMVGREHRQLGHAARRVEADRGRERLALLRLSRRKRACATLCGEIDLQPIGRIMPRDIASRSAAGQSFISARNSACAIATRRSRSTSEKPPVSTGSVS